MSRVFLNWLVEGKGCEEGEDVLTSECSIVG